MWLSPNKKCGVILTVKIQPNSKKSEILGVHGGFLKIRIAAPPVDGAANDATKELLSEALGIRLSAIELLRGFSSRIKVLRIQGVGISEIEEKLTPRRLF